MPDGIEWGPVGEWFGGVGGFLAVGVAVWIARRESRRADEAVKMSLRQEMAARRQVAARLKYQHSGLGHSSDGYMIDESIPVERNQINDAYGVWHPQQVVGWRFTLMNDHVEPFDDVVAVASFPTVAEVSPVRVPVGSVPVQGPNVRLVEFEVPFPPEGGKHDEVPEIELTFTDADGSRWVKHPDGGVESAD